MSGAAALRVEDYSFWFKPAAGAKEGPAAFAGVFFVVSVVYLAIQFNPANMQWNMDL